MSPTEHRASAILVDDHPDALAAAYEIMKDDFDIVATVMDGNTALHAMSLFYPEIVVLSIDMPGKGEFETARAVRRLSPAARIVFLTMAEDVEYISAACQIGGNCVLKQRMHADLLKAVRAAMDGTLFVSPILPSHSSLT